MGAVFMDYNQYFSEELSDEEILKSFAIVLPYLNNLMRDDTAFGLSVDGKYICSEQAEGFDLQLEYGTEVVETVKNCMKSGKIEKGDIPASVLGRAIKVIAIPIKNSKGQIIGTISDGIDVENANQMVNSINEIAQSVVQVSSGVSELAEAATELAKSGQSAINLAEINMENSKKTTEALELIKSIADKINLLGLNAAIESARAGEQGRGFSVVSSEIRKLATQSKESVASIKGIVEKMNESVNNITKAIDDSAAVSEEQAGAIEEISATIESINENLRSLSESSKRFL
jgi:Methyl-accepting chemotaxis protein